MYPVTFFGEKSQLPIEDALDDLLEHRMYAEVEKILRMVDCTFHRYKEYKEKLTKLGYEHSLKS